MIKQIEKVIINYVFGPRTKGTYAYPKVKINTTQPDNTLSYNEWMWYHKVSNRVSK
jgi:IS1 family transposase